MINTYSKKKDSSKFLSAHFQVREFACKDGTDKIIINSDLIDTLEKLYTALDVKFGIKAINITSGYRTDSHSKRVGGYAGDQHTKGNASDITVKLKNGTLLSAKEVCLVLEDLNHQGGIGYISSNSTHVDVRGKKCWFDETKNEKTTNSWYTYFGIKKATKNSSNEVVKEVVNNYPTKTTKIVNLRVRNGANILSKTLRFLKIGTKVTCYSTKGGWTKISADKNEYVWTAYLK